MTLPENDPSLGAAAAAAAPPPDSVAAPPPQPATSNGAASSPEPAAPTVTVEDRSATASTGKRKREASASPQKSPMKAKAKAVAAAQPVQSDEELVEKRKAVVETVSGDLLAALTEYDPTPSVLGFSLPLSGGSNSPPAKRNKVAANPVPDTISERLQQRTYGSFTALLSDIRSACRAILAEISVSDGTDGAVARVVHFSQLAKDIVNRERVKHADIFDLVEELEGDDEEEDIKPASYVGLTVMGHHGPLFSSFQKPENIVVSSIASSRATSSSSQSPKSASTAPTSVSPPSPRPKTEQITVVTPLPRFNIPPMVTLTEGTSEKDLTAKRPLNTPTSRVPTLGESFPGPSALALLPPQPSPPGKPAHLGLHWGGKLAPGGARIYDVNSERTEPSGSWLLYRNQPDPARWSYEPFRRGIGLPPDFVAAYSTFAPTCDSTAAKVPPSIRDKIWWEKHGGRTFRRMFSNDPQIGDMFKEYDPPEPLDDEEIRHMVESFDEASIDPALSVSPGNAEASGGDAEMKDAEAEADAVTDGDETKADPVDADALLKEIGTLLTTLQSQQYARLAQRNTLLTPTAEELSTYNALNTRLTTLLGQLPPHLVATLDGHPDSALSLSKKIPILTNGPAVIRGKLPTSATEPLSTPTQQLQGASLTALNAAAGISPVSAGGSAPVASMGPLSSSGGSPRKMHGTPAPVHYPPQTPAQQMRRSTSASYQAPQTAPQQRNVAYPPYGPGFAQGAHTVRTRNSVPPPQGLAAVGVGYNSPMPQRSMPAGGIVGGTRRR